MMYNTYMSHHIVISREIMIEVMMSVNLLPACIRQIVTKIQYTNQIVIELMTVKMTAVMLTRYVKFSI